MDRALRKDLRILGHFIDVYCHRKHPDRHRSVMHLRTHDVAGIVGHPVELCTDCGKLLIHAYSKRSHCPLEPKPACKHCPQHCYHPRWRARIQEVMRYSGRQVVLSGRLDYLLHLLF